MLKKSGKITLKFTIEGGDFKLVSGIACAKQTIRLNLSTGFGEWFADPLSGSHFSDYYHQFNENPELLNRLLKLEITRLLSIPHTGFAGQEPTPPLNFINRVLEVEIQSTRLEANAIPVRLKLEWGNGEIWEDEINISVRSE